jgi:hypothetical protein
MYIEAAERVLPGARKVVRAATGAIKGYELWLTHDGAALALQPVPDATAPSLPNAGGELQPAQPQEEGMQ